ncbi:transposase InsH for insertion sequence element IS5B [Bacteroidia bacterium]|nr:transposase InsH for insertion sequence element IS5B [Bacteroidia bacterium]
MQINIFAEDSRLARLSELGDKLETITNAPICWEKIVGALERYLPDRTQTRKGGRPPISKLLLFKITLLKKWYGLSNESAEYQINDRLSFQRVLGLSLSDRVPDSNTIRMFEEALNQTGADLEIFYLFVEEMEKMGIVTHTGSIVDATFVEAPRQRNSREENKRIKEGAIPEERKDKKKAHKDTDARWTKKNEVTYYGYKDHINVDKDSKIITDFRVTDASVHDSREMTELINESDKEMWFDSAYVSEDLRKAAIKKNSEVKLHINEKGYKGKPLTDEQKENNRIKSKVRARVEHVNGNMTVCGRLFVRTIGMLRAETYICLKNLAYNISRFSFLANKAA